VSSQNFVAAWQHLVTIFRQQGADNVYWLWTLQADQAGTGPIRNWWPGPDYVSWVGIDGFYSKPSDSFTSVFGKTIHQVRGLTNRPMLLAETAVGPQANQIAGILNLFEGARNANVLGLVWYDIAQHGGIDPQDWRIESSPTAEPAFQLGVKDLFGSSG